MHCFHTNEMRKGKQIPVMVCSQPFLSRKRSLPALQMHGEDSRAAGRGEGITQSSPLQLQWAQKHESVVSPICKAQFPFRK